MFAFLGLGARELILLLGLAAVALIGVVVILVLVPRLTRSKDEPRNE